MDKENITPEEQFYIDNQMHFTEELNNKADEQIQKFHIEQKQNRDGILTEIAKVILSYNVVKEIMNFENSEKKMIETKLIKMINEKVQAELNNETKLTKDLLKSTGKNKYDINNYIYSLGTDDIKNIGNKIKEDKHKISNVVETDDIKDKALDDIINTKVDEKLWSDRLWDNKNEIAKDLRAEIRDFLNGKTSVNEIEEKIKKKYNTNAHETKRLVQDNVARVQEGVSEQWREEHDVKYVLYMATLCNNTCANCRQYDGKSYEVSKKPVSLPQHCFCRCTYVSIPNPDWHPKMRIDNETKKNIKWQSFQEWDANKVKPMNLQLFGINEKEELNKLILSGAINKEKYIKCNEYFTKQFANGISSPIENISNNKNRFIHIASRHQYMISEQQIDNIVDSLKNPDKIYKTVDKFGNIGNGYVKNINNKELLTIVRNDIITSYYPSKNYIKKVKRGELIWEGK